MAGKYWTQEEVNLLKKVYNSGKPVRDIMLEFPERTRYSVYIKACSLGIKTDYVERKYNYKKDFWSQYTKENCYIGGFAAADSCIMQRKDGGYTFATEIKDKEHLIKMKNLYAEEYPVVDRKGGTYYVKCNVCSKWANDLENNFNITQRKTYTLKFPTQIPEKFIPYWLCGFIDGDGCFHKCKNRESFSLSFVAASNDILDGINKYISRYYESFNRKERRVNILNNKDKNSTLYSLAIGGVAACNIYLDLRSYIPELHLSRKWDRPEYIDFCRSYSERFKVNKSKIII